MTTGDVKPVKHSISLLIRDAAEPGRFLVVRRSADDAEHPGSWGLAAGSFRPGESALDLIRRIGRDKLGVVLVPVQRLRSGEQVRERYLLQMELWEVRIAAGVPAARRGSDQGVSYYEGLRWAGPDVLRDGRSQGSLCCRLGLEVFESGPPQEPDSGKQGGAARRGDAEPHRSSRR